jgi:hypothetical protein
MGSQFAARGGILRDTEDAVNDAWVLSVSPRANGAGR